MPTVRKPHGKVVDPKNYAVKPLALKIKSEDIDNAVDNNKTCCVIAQAIHRTVKPLWAEVGTRRVKIIGKNGQTSYYNLQKASREAIGQFDETKEWPAEIKSLVLTPVSDDELNKNRKSAKNFHAKVRKAKKQSPLKTAATARDRKNEKSFSRRVIQFSAIKQGMVSKTVSA